MTILYNKRLFLLVIFGLLLSLLMTLFWFITFERCTDDLGCLAFLIIPLFPGFSLGLEGAYSIIVSLIFWFLIGSLIGYVIYKLKK